MSKNKEIATRINKIAREVRLEQEEANGRLRSNSWDGRPSHRQNRRKIKEVLKNFNDDQDLDDLMD